MLKQNLLFASLLIFQISCSGPSQSIAKENQEKTNINGRVNVEKVTDFDGNEYATVEIAGEIWTAENLRSLHYSDGTKIEEVHVFDDDEKNAAILGRLYTWETAVGKWGICPKGWRLPTDDDFKKMERHLGMAEEDIEDTGWRDTNSEGIRLKKEQKDFLWFDYSKRGVNSTGFSVIPTGVRTSGGYYIGGGAFADIWTSTEFDAETALNRSLTWSWPHPGKAKIYRKPVDKKWGFSVRCIKIQ